LKIQTQTYLVFASCYGQLIVYDAYAAHGDYAQDFAPGWHRENKILCREITVHEADRQRGRRMAVKAMKASLSDSERSRLQAAGAKHVAGCNRKRC